MSDHLMPDERSQKDIEMDQTTLLLHGTTDAMVWAREWCRIAREVEARGESLIDEGWMVGWFANAMGVAEMLARGAAADRLTELDAKVAAVVAALDQYQGERYTWNGAAEYCVSAVAKAVGP